MSITSPCLGIHRRITLSQFRLETEKKAILKILLILSKVQSVLANMIEVIFTLDYEIYGNGEGFLRELVYEPAAKLMEVFNKFENRFVAFVEAAELEKIKEHRSDKAIDQVRGQIEDLYKHGFEIGLHIHPQWYNAQRENGKWALDYSEYNLCVLPRERIRQIVDKSIGFLRNVLGDSVFKPLSFRAGNWLFQPALPVAGVLAEHGVRVDSSVFKGGLQRQQGLDYRRALKNGYFWRFATEVNVEDTQGTLLELPIYTQMVPFWKMATGKRIGLQQKSGGRVKSGKGRFSRLTDFLRFRYPQKLDFCRMTKDELTSMMDRVLEEDQASPTEYRPIVAIGHTKDLVDTETVEAFLSYLDKKKIPVTTFEKIYPKVAQG